MRKAVWVVVCSLVLAMVGAVAPATAAPPPPPLPGAAGIGDPYFPLDGNGGYDVRHYDLQLSYTPSADLLRGRAVISARATQSLSRFDLDLHGLTVDAITVGGGPAAWTRVGDELQVTPRRTLAKRSNFDVVVDYHGVPVHDLDGGMGGVFTTDDGAPARGSSSQAATTTATSG